MKRVLLTTTGRRTGRPRPVTLYAFEDRGALVVVGSAGGSRGDPAWVLNLRARPRATIRRGRAEQEVRAAEVGGAERERLWELVCREFPLYATYQRRTARRIPLFVLQPREG